MDQRWKEHLFFPPPVLMLLWHNKLRFAPLKLENKKQCIQGQIFSHLHVFAHLTNPLQFKNNLMPF